MNSMIGRRKKQRQTAPKQKQGTTLTFTADELTALARYLAAGAVLLQTSHPVLGRVRGAVSRLGLPRPQGL